MRLIDADKTKVYTYDLDKQVFVDVITRFISLQPTVEAIPIEWIKKWFSQFYGEQGLEWNRCKRFMLEDWEKENKG